MSAPTVNPAWDTSLVNVVVPTGTQFAQGWATNAVPASGNINYILNAHGQWIAWLTSVIGSTQQISALGGTALLVSGTSANCFAVTDATGTRLRINKSNNSDVVAWCLPIAIPQGRKITAARGTVHDVNATTALAVKVIATTTSGDTVLASANSANNGTTQTIALTPSTTIASATWYAITVTNSASATTGAYDVWGAEVDFSA